jgi:hypothetical protein
MNTPATPAHRILYCRCRYAQVVPEAVKEEVLRQLCESGVEFEAVPDLCELSARRDPALKHLAGGGALKIAACYPRAVKWLLANTGVRLAPASTEVLNMRTQPAAEIVNSLFAPELKPNLPPDRPNAGSISPKAD